MRPVLTHLALHVRDPGYLHAFYRDYCGMQVVHESVTDGHVWYGWRNPTGTGIHFCVSARRARREQRPRTIAI